MYSIFAAQSTFWVITLKVANKGLVLGNEQQWTFSQMLMIAIAVLVLFMTVDTMGGEVLLSLRRKQWYDSLSLRWWRK